MIPLNRRFWLQTVLIDQDPGKTPNHTEDRVRTQDCPPFLACFNQINRISFVKTETYLIKDDACALLSKGEIVVLMGIQSYPWSGSPENTEYEVSFSIS